MSKVSIIGARPQLIGDTIFVEPLLNHWKIKYPDSHITWCIANKCKQIVPLWQDHPLIDEILVSSDDEGNIYNINGKFYNQKTDVLPFDIRTPDFNPPVPANVSYNQYNCVELAWLMAGESLENYYKLSESQKSPHLYTNKRLHEIKKYYKPFISIWPFAGYSNGFSRSPSVEWWKEMVKILIIKGYGVWHFGHFNEPILSQNNNYDNFTQCALDFQIRLASDSFMSVGTDSGSHWAVGALGKAPIINLLTYHMPGHHTNKYALAPMHSKGNVANLFHPDSCSNISHEDVLETIDSFDLLS